MVNKGVHKVNMSEENYLGDDIHDALDIHLYIIEIPTDSTKIDSINEDYDIILPSMKTPHQNGQKYAYHNCMIDDINDNQSNEKDTDSNKLIDNQINENKIMSL